MRENPSSVGIERFWEGAWPRPAHCHRVLSFSEQPPALHPHGRTVEAQHTPPSRPRPPALPSPRLPPALSPPPPHLTPGRNTGHREQSPFRVSQNVRHSTECFLTASFNPQTTLESVSVPNFEGRKQTQRKKSRSPTITLPVTSK